MYTSLPLYICLKLYTVKTFTKITDRYMQKLPSPPYPDTIGHMDEEKILGNTPIKPMVFYAMIWDIFCVVRLLL